MAKEMFIDVAEKEKLARVAHALSVPIRLDILQLLKGHSYNIAEISKKLSIPSSSTAMHVQILENAELILVERQPGERGIMKLCSCRQDSVEIKLNQSNTNSPSVTTISMPIGLFTDSHIVSPCGLADRTGYLFDEDKPELFYTPKRTTATILWSSGGFVEYRFPYPAPSSKKIKSLSVSLEVCSEAPNYREKWPSDISFRINDVLFATWRSPGDFGNRRGTLNPDWWESSNTQYGSLVSYTVTEKGTYLNGKLINKTTINDLLLSPPFLTLQIGNDADAEYIGGFNIFGKDFGDFRQDILLSAEF